MIVFDTSFDGEQRVVHDFYLRHIALPIQRKWDAPNQVLRDFFSSIPDTPCRRSNSSSTSWIVASLTSRRTSKWNNVSADSEISAFLSPAAPTMTVSTASSPNFLAQSCGPPCSSLAVQELRGSACLRSRTTFANCSKTFHCSLTGILAFNICFFTARIENWPK